MILYDPLTWENLMAGMIVRFEGQPKMPFTSPIEVQGPGVYALLYAGDFDAYGPISGRDRPIYVGKAIPPGSRKGTDILDSSAPALRARLRNHARSLQSVHNLDLSDFSYRCLAVVPVWITLAERFLVEHYRPVWNKSLDGFGNNDQGERRNTKASWWDTLHPGRTWANKLERSHTVNDARDRVRQFFIGGPPQ